MTNPLLLVHSEAGDWSVWASRERFVSREERLVLAFALA